MSMPPGAGSRCLTTERPPSADDDPVAHPLLGDDEKSFVRLMWLLLSNSRTDRTHAEQVLLSLSEKYPELLCLRTLSLLWSPLRGVRFHAAVLLRQFFVPTSVYHLWPRITPACQENIKLLLLLSLQQEEVRYVAVAKSDTISDLASALPDPLFPEFRQLLPSVLFAICLGTQQVFVEANLRLFSGIVKRLADILPERILTLRSILWVFLSAPDFSPGPRVAGLLACSSLVQSLPPSEGRTKLHDMLLFFHLNLLHALARKDEVIARKVLELLIDFAGAEPNFFTNFVARTTIVRDVLAVTKDHQLEDGTRHLALEFVITIAEASKPAPGLTPLLRQMPHCVRKLFSILLEMLMDVDNDVAWLDARLQGKEPNQSDNYTLALESLDRLVFALGGNTIVKAIVDLLPNYLNDLFWKKRHAALFGLAQISQGCSKVSL